MDILPLDKIFVIVSGLVAIVFVYWFFFMKKEVAVSATDEINIKVEGGYQPDIIKILPNRTTKLNFTRTDPSGCLEEIVIGDLSIRRYLPLNQTVTIELTPTEIGEHIFSCSMNMYHGKIIVENQDGQH